MREFRRLSDAESEESWQSDNVEIVLLPGISDDSESSFVAHVSPQPSPQPPSPAPSSPAAESDEDSDDSLVQAIAAAKKRKPMHPPEIKFKNFVHDLSFHPSEPIIATASVTGDLFMHKYTVNTVTQLKKLELHKNACRNVEYFNHGDFVVSCGKDNSIMITDTHNLKLKQFVDDAFTEPPTALYTLNETLFATGDESGTLHVWDTREKKPVHTYKTGDEQITAIITENDEKMIACTVCDHIVAYDFIAGKFFAQSEPYDTELTCMSLMKRETKLVVGSGSGKMYIFNWGQFGYHSDIFPGIKRGINTVIDITENILINGCEDGKILGTNFFPNKHLGVVGQHKMSVEAIDISHDGKYIATASLDETVKFWDIRYFEDIHVAAERSRRKREAQDNNLPSSEVANPGDFFAGLN